MEDIETIGILYVCWLTLMSLTVLPWLFSRQFRRQESSTTGVAGLLVVNFLSTESALILVDAGKEIWAPISLEAQDIVLAFTASAIALSWAVWLARSVRTRWSRPLAHLSVPVLRGGGLVQASGRFSIR